MKNGRDERRTMEVRLGDELTNASIEDEGDQRMRFERQRGSMLTSKVCVSSLILLSNRYQAVADLVSGEEKREAESACSIRLFRVSTRLSGITTPTSRLKPR